MSGTTAVILIGSGLLGIGIWISLFLEDHRSKMKEIKRMKDNPDDALKSEVGQIQIRQPSGLQISLPNLGQAAGHRDNNVVVRGLLEINEGLHRSLDKREIAAYIDMLELVQKAYEKQSQVSDAKDDFENRDILREAKRLELEARRKRAELENAELDDKINKVKNPSPPPAPTLKPPQKSDAEKEAEYQVRLGALLELLRKDEKDLIERGYKGEDLEFKMDEMRRARGYHNLLKKRP